MKISENIEEIIIGVMDDTLIMILKDVNYRDIRGSRVDFDSLDIGMIKDQLKKDFRRGYYANLTKIEASLCRYTHSEIIYSEAYKQDIMDRNSVWMTPFLAIFKFFGFEYYMDYLNETINMDIEELLDFSKKSGIDPGIIYNAGSFNSCLYFENEDKINALYDRTRRNDKIQRLKSQMSKKD